MAICVQGGKLLTCGDVLSRLLICLKISLSKTARPVPCTFQSLILMHMFARFKRARHKSERGADLEVGRRVVTPSGLSRFSWGRDHLANSEVSGHHPSGDSIDLLSGQARK